MQIHCRLIDWDFATSKSARELIDEMTEAEGDESWLGCVDGEKWPSTSFMDYVDTCDVLKRMKDSISDFQAQYVTPIYSALFSENERADELGLSKESHCYPISVSPAAVSKLREHMKRLCQDTYILSALESHDKEGYSLFGYLKQWQSVIEAAHEIKRGLLIHVG
jgi:hypothetical protein